VSPWWSSVSPSTMIPATATAAIRTRVGRV